MPNVTPSVYPILRNARMYAPQRLQSRPGLVKIAGAFGAAQSVHSIRRLNDPIDGTFTRILGAGTSLYQSGSTAAIDTGYSGNPLSLVPFRPPNSPQSWMYVADSARMRKVMVDGTNYQMGVAPPLQPPVVDPIYPAVEVIDELRA